MTQEELDALMNGGDSSLNDADLPDEAQGVAAADSDKKSHAKDDSSEFDPDNFRVQASKQWPPPPPDRDNKVVHQLDDVTRDTEVKAGEVFDQLDIVSANAENILKSSKKLKEYLAHQEELFTKLAEHFPHVESFKGALESTKAIKQESAKIADAANACSDAMLQAMDIMQFQDINRQRIERVINVMRALAQYMNSLFESKIDDSKRVASAVYIAGDDNPNIADAEDIENLIASFGNKK
ncbi:chemotaxis protein [Helicobacter sp. CLO-3]|uniref:chemotaxis protein n=1 Tax=unclassified Helicobacter TaxID=2593540 RepID=UPI000805B293|nr:MULTISPECIES: chemotaxis protein [unclassified Helicobacter]OBV28348.1 chemotaxis protein [Helicobacter sp. CLO-3]OHU84513.1 chemotaxis protein [Helicobacter sp. CLO-3]